jgi:hypothetical protein
MLQRFDDSNSWQIIYSSHGAADSKMSKAIPTIERVKNEEKQFLEYRLLYKLDAEDCTSRLLGTTADCHRYQIKLSG